MASFRIKVGTPTRLSLVKRDKRHRLRTDKSWSLRTPTAGSLRGTIRGVQTCPFCTLWPKGLINAAGNNAVRCRQPKGEILTVLPILTIIDCFTPFLRFKPGFLYGPDTVEYSLDH